MSSRAAKGSSLSNLISQWCHQQQQDHRAGESSSTNKQPFQYRILLQSTTSLETRLQAAGSLSKFADKEKSSATTTTSSQDEDQVYRRAGLRTPAETAIRDLFGGPAWLVRILQVGTQQPQGFCRVVFVRTQSRSLLLPSTLESKLTVLDSSQDPWGWDDDSDNSCDTRGENNQDVEVRTKISLQNLSQLYQSIVSSCQSNPDCPVLLVWESLAPLFLVHGFDRTLRFLEAIDTLPGRKTDEDSTDRCTPILQVWSIRMETLPPMQHARMEDAANSLMCLVRGEMTLMRQGIREKGNVVREVLPFRLVQTKPAVQEMEGGMAFWLEEQEDALTDTSRLADEEQKRTEFVTPDEDNRGAKRLGRSKIQLRLESEEENVQGQSDKEPEPDISRPRIYLQDDDPEFADMDEEDPDDDLDI